MEIWTSLSLSRSLSVACSGRTGSRAPSILHVTFPADPLPAFLIRFRSGNRRTRNDSPGIRRDRRWPVGGAGRAGSIIVDTPSSKGSPGGDPLADPPPPPNLDYNEDKRVCHYFKIGLPSSRGCLIPVANNRDWANTHTLSRPSVPGLHSARGADNRGGEK